MRISKTAIVSTCRDVDTRRASRLGCNAGRSLEASAASPAGPGSHSKAG